MCAVCRSCPCIGIRYGHLPGGAAAGEVDDGRAVDELLRRIQYVPVDLGDADAMICGLVGQYETHLERIEHAAEIGHAGTQLGIVPGMKVIRKMEATKILVRARIEYPLQVPKRQFGYTKVRFRGLAKHATQLVTLFCPAACVWMPRQHMQASAGDILL